MSSPTGDLSSRFLEVISPSATDVRLAIRMVLKALAGGQSLFTGALVRAVCGEAGISAGCGGPFPGSP